MQSNLVIVESPTKAKTIEKILGDEFVVKSSKGHIRDLKSKGLSIDIENNFKPEYEIPSDKTSVVTDLKKAVKASKMVWLASDEDREGEAIAWHLYDVLKLKPENAKRIAFHEITAKAIKEALEHPRDIDNNLVEAQQARRILDRLVGFQLSPILWKKVKPSLSAGRVQSVTVRLIVDKEREIQNFKQKTYYRITATLVSEKGETFDAELNKKFDDYDTALSFLNRLKSGQGLKVENITTTPAKRTPAPAFTTSTLQQEASRKLGFSVSQTMNYAQKLYEAGHITYMRTDSANLSTFAIKAAEDEIVKIYGKSYHKSRQYKTKAKGAQEAHEAIRPTHFENHDAGSTLQEKKLYSLIWKRAVASQMADAKLDRTVVSINIIEEDGSIAKEKFISQGEIMIFDGFLKLYTESKNDDEENDSENIIKIPILFVGDSVSRVQVVATQRFTNKPARYSEASLISKLEELGIGRPSTYAPTISTIIARNYIQKANKEGTTRQYKQFILSGNNIKESNKTEKTGTEKQKFIPTDIGMLVTDYLMEYFPRIMDYDFTANVENEFDEIASGKIKWQEMIQNFYGPFNSDITHVSENGEFAHSERLLGVDPATNKDVIARIGRYGPMIQIGDPQDKKFAKIPSGKLIETITLEEALDLFALPRSAGQFEGHEMVVGVGRFGAYVKHNNIFTSLEKSDDPLTVTSERLIELIEKKREREKNKVINVFEKENIQVLNGRWGPYISFDGNNYKIAKDLDAKNLTVEDCKKIIALQNNDQVKKQSASSKRTAKK